MNPGPKPQPRPRAKVVVRDLDRGVPRSANGNHTSIRLEENDRRLLRLIVEHRERATGERYTVSGEIRRLLRAEAKTLGIKLKG